jgi:hypothetical protein
LPKKHGKPVRVGLEAQFSSGFKLKKKRIEQMWARVFIAKKFIARGNSAKIAL